MNNLKDLNEPMTEYITVQKRDYDCMQMEILFLRNEATINTLIEKVKKEEGIIFYIKDLYPREGIGFITCKSLEERTNKFIEFFNKYEKLPRFIKWLINKIS